jgi:peptide deformylase
MGFLAADDPRLRDVATPVRPEEFGSADVAAMVEQLKAGLEERPGVGLAGPQIGIPRRIVRVQDPLSFHTDIPPEYVRAIERAPIEPYVLLNPEVEALGEEVVIAFEACLSVGVESGAFVRRAKRVRLRYVDLDGEEHDEVVSGWHARILQHEADHLDGILILDRMIAGSLMPTEVFRERWRFREGREVIEALGLG